MARGTPGTVGSKGGGNVVPSTGPDFTALSALGTSASIPNVGFPTRGRILRSQIPVGRGTVPDDYDYGRIPQRRFPPFTRPPIRPQRPPFISRPSPIRPMPRPSMGSGASNFYRRPSYSYGVPTGLGSLLSGQQSPFGRMVDPATGFPQRSFPRPVMGRPDFGQIGRSTSSGKSGSKGGAKTVTPEPKDPPISDNRINLDSFRELNPQIETGNERPTIPKDLGRRFDVGRPRPDIVQSVRIDPDILDRGTVYRPPNQISNDRPMITENPMFFANNPPPTIMPRSDLIPAGPAPSISQIPDLIPARPARSVSQTPEESLRQRALAGNRTGTGLDLPPVVTAPRQVELMPALAPPPPTPPRLPAQERTGFSGAMEQAGVRPNIRPTMNVGKATGGPVGIHSGIASLVGRR